MIENMAKEEIEENEAVSCLNLNAKWSDKAYKPAF